MSDEQQRDYQRLKEKIELRFGQTYLKQVRQVEFKYSKPKPNETFQEYEPDVVQINCCWQRTQTQLRNRPDEQLQFLTGSEQRLTENK